jgi:hypothetical protein
MSPAHEIRRKSPLSRGRWEGAASRATGVTFVTFQLAVGVPDRASAAKSPSRGYRDLRDLSPDRGGRSPRAGRLMMV